MNQFDSFAALTATLSEKVDATLVNMMKRACDFKDTSGLKKLFINLSPFSKGKEG